MTHAVLAPGVQCIMLDASNSNVTDAAIYGWAYETYYQGIYRANQVLENVPKSSLRMKA